MKKWFGKGCKYLTAVWEEDEITGGPDYKEFEPVLVHCTHPKNVDDHEGNCNKFDCPLKKDSENERH